MQRIWIALCLLLLGSCSPSSLEDFQREGTSLSRKMIIDLQQIQTTEQLIEKAPLLKKRFYYLVELMIQARTYQEAHPEEIPLEPTSASDTFNELFIIELERLYSLERGKEIIENTQRDALHRLDAFERGFKNRREKLILRP